MQDIWIESFYNEIDAEKRQAFLKEHTGDPKDELDEFREKLWIARYGKRKPKNDAFVGYLMQMKAMTIWISRSRRWYSMR